MCLTLSDTEIRIAKEDIVCYKVFAKQDDTLISPYRNMRYECGKMYVSETPIIVKYEHGPMNTAYVEEGFHSFSNKNEADFLKPDLSIWTAYDKCVVVKCLIPAGTRYAAGFFFEFGYSFDSFCSERIIAVEEV